MAALNPEALFRRIAADLPEELRKHVFVIGSLAAAYHFQRELQGRGVNTKDADLIVHPAGDVTSCANLAERLFDLGWRPTVIPPCVPAKSKDDPKELTVLRLRPPDSDEYFVELLNLPAAGQRDAKLAIPVQVKGGWYELPTFRFQGLTGYGRLTSNTKLEYASPAAMALANLLSHPTIGEKRVTQPIGGRRPLRAGKDLGRVLALATLAGRESTEAWLGEWRSALQAGFPKEWREIARGAGRGLRALLVSEEGLEDARHTCEIGLLAGKGHTAGSLKAVGERLLMDVVEGLEAEGAVGDPNAG